MSRRDDQYLASLDANDRPLTAAESREFLRLGTQDNLDAGYERLRDDEDEAAGR